VLTDFGIAHIAGSALTQLGDLLGTPAYLSPEQLRGDLPDQRSDVFAAGVLLYEVTTGRRPFDGSVAEVMRQILFDEPAPPSRLQPQLAVLDGIVVRALAKEPGLRFATAGAFANALQELPLDASRPVVVPASAPAARPRSLSASPIEGLERAFDAARRGIDRELATFIGDLITQLRPEDVPRAAVLCVDRGLPAIAQQLYATAPLPGQAAARTVDADDWLYAARLARPLYEVAQHSSQITAAATVLATLAHALACDILAFASDVSERLTADEAPDLEVLAPDLAQVDKIALAFDSLFAPRERRLVSGTLQLVTGQILRRAASFIDRYARDRDPLIRFDVVNMLVQMEALIAITSRLLEDTHSTGGLLHNTPSADAGRENAIAVRNVAALTVFLRAITDLVDVSEELLAAALQGDTEATAADFISHLRQLRLIYRFAIRLDGPAYRQPLSSLVQGIYDLSVRFGRELMASPSPSPSQHRCLSALHDLAEELEWRELAAQLLAYSRRALLAPSR
jgi:serine/threonine-protein kinase